MPVFRYLILASSCVSGRFVAAPGLLHGHGATQRAFPSSHFWTLGVLEVGFDGCRRTAQDSTVREPPLGRMGGTTKPSWRSKMGAGGSQSLPLRSVVRCEMMRVPLAPTRMKTVAAVPITR
jgi:hypothetical protein